MEGVEHLTLYRGHPGHSKEGEQENGNQYQYQRLVHGRSEESSGQPKDVVKQFQSTLKRPARKYRSR